MPFEPKYDTPMNELLKMRVTPEQKALLSLVSASAGYESMSEFWRELNLKISVMLQKVSSGEMTPDEFGKQMEQVASDYKARYGDEP